VKHALFVALLVSLSMVASAKADCFGARSLRLVEGQFVEMAMTVKAGKSCTLNLGSIGMTVERRDVTSRPKHGSVTFGPTSMRYTAVKGFSGADAYSFAWKGTSRFGTATLMGVNMAVTIEP